MNHGEPNPLGYLLPLLILAPVLYFRSRRMMGSRPLKLETLWIRPAIIVVMAGFVIAAIPPHPGDWPWLALAGMAGALAGWQWGRVMSIHVDPEKGTLMATGGQAAMMVFVLLVVARMAVRSGLQMEASAWHIDAALISDASIVFAALLFAVRGLEMFLRARRVVAGGGS